MFISIIIFNLNKFFPINKKINLEKRIPFECGFNPKFILPFPILFFFSFFQIRLLFSIFDIEITLSIPIIFYLKYINFYYMLNTILLFIFIILFTLIIE
ncbi:hypothetical protein E2986_13813 [Frieseomelitta varia]|uniref:NADH-ubiquinone oxidoreductase chain 3 n=1 Tax=Frieseomelitta varia TaxID=561572 RepID=A0A833SCS6_9HYME|nr:hypothetical protein E2986_13813 [Frieseomelitta varia]